MCLKMVMLIEWINEKNGKGAMRMRDIISRCFIGDDGIEGWFEVES